MPKSRGDTQVDLLVKRLRNRGFLIPDGWIFQSFKRGKHQKAAGLYSWSLRWVEAGKIRELGSKSTVTEFLTKSGVVVEWVE